MKTQSTTSIRIAKFKFIKFIKFIKYYLGIKKQLSLTDFIITIIIFIINYLYIYIKCDIPTRLNQKAFIQQNNYLRVKHYQKKNVLYSSYALLIKRDLLVTSL